MDSLGDVYSRAITEKFEYPDGWMANWPAGFDTAPGDVGEIDGDGEGFNKDGVLSDYGITAERDPAVGTPDGSWDYTSSSEIKVEIKVDASLPSWEFIGNAKAGLKCGFGSSGGLVLAVGSAHQEGLADLAHLREELIAKAENGEMKEGTAVIVQQHVGDTGLVITSEGHSGDVSATTNFDVGGAGTPTLASFAADFNLHSKSQSVAENSFPNGFTIAFRVIKLGKRGWFWWRHWSVFGITQITDEDLEMLLGPDDYFAPLPEAEFSGVA